MAVVVNTALLGVQLGAPLLPSRSVIIATTRRQSECQRHAQHHRDHRVTLLTVSPSRGDLDLSMVTPIVSLVRADSARLPCMTLSSPAGAALRTCGRDVGVHPEEVRRVVLGLERSIEPLPLFGV